VTVAATQNELPLVNLSRLRVLALERIRQIDACDTAADVRVVERPASRKESLQFRPHELRQHEDSIIVAFAPRTVT
jgi:hypothetical protein